MCVVPKQGTPGLVSLLKVDDLDHQACKKVTDLVLDFIQMGGNAIL